MPETVARLRDCFDHLSSPAIGIGRGRCREDIFRILALAVGLGGVKIGRLNILVIEDDPKTAQALRRGLAAEGYAATVAETGDDGASRLATDAYDLVVLDWMLPGQNGIEILKTLRRRKARVPVLLLTARDAVEDRVLGLDAGADDYLVKPFAFAELLARIRVLFRRAAQVETMTRQVGDLVLDLQSRRAWRGGAELSLTPREFELLSCLIRHEGEVVTRPMLAEEVWREPNRATPLDNVIDVHLAHLRRKVDEGRHGRLIQTIRGVGFTLREETRP